jgi:hypothetical protein
MSSNNLNTIQKAFFDFLVPIGYKKVSNTIDNLGIQIYLTCHDCNEVLQNSLFTDMSELPHLIEVGKKNQEWHNLCVVGDKINA